MLLPPTPLFPFCSPLPPTPGPNLHPKKPSSGRVVRLIIHHNTTIPLHHFFTWLGGTWSAAQLVPWPPALSHSTPNVLARSPQPAGPSPRSPAPPRTPPAPETHWLKIASTGRPRVLPAAPNRRIVCSLARLDNRRKIEESTILKVLVCTFYEGLMLPFQVL